ncbi:amidohydrolase family protein [Kangiella sediminilitoris]|uniref:Imidazolonepropionase n=1 Tax=Kangiella sediminilitoris TaxID=1144748 RepID=A0A1B3BAS2_9GAMM|nr:amidohydrolase family protein [Kangiella sediminilitoris]AOE49898.1 Imidazolonepropionase [Kangiella sediminilitoris]
MSKLLKSLAVLSLVTIFLDTSAQAETILIKNAKVHTMTSAATLDDADILIKDGLIQNIGEGLSADNAKIIDAEGKQVTSGIFALANQIGLVEISAIEGTNDTANQLTELNASFRVDDVFNPKSTLIPMNRAGGVTRTLIKPYNGLSLFAGYGAIMDLTGEYDSLILSDVAVFATYGELASSLTGGSRASALHEIKNAFSQAKEYQQNAEAIKRGEYRELDYSIDDLEAIASLLKGDIPFVVNVDRASDILTIITFAKDHQLNLVLSGVAEGWKVAGKIAEANVPVMVDPMNNIPGSFESLGQRYDNAALLDKAGVDVMFYGSTHNADNVRQAAGNAVAYGMPYDKALAAFTSTPAKVFGGASNYGKLMPGFKAELVVWSGDPFEVTTYPEVVIIDGKVQSLMTRAKRLEQRYKDISTDKNTFYRK